jgi:hypothetical protein
MGFHGFYKFDAAHLSRDAHIALRKKDLLGDQQGIDGEVRGHSTVAAFTLALTSGTW